ncbi:MAG: CooT family nickel-binding protein [bacterium]
MCESNVYLEDNGKEEIFMESVDIIKPDEGKLYLKSIFGEQKVVEARIKEISLVDHRIVLKK